MSGPGKKLEAGLPYALLSIVLVLVLVQPVMAQSGWVRKKGETFSQLSYAGYTSDTYYNLEGEQVETAEFYQHNLYLYSEYGISEKLSILMNVPLMRAQGFSTTESVWGIGDLRLDAKYGFFQEVLPIAVSLGVEVPWAKPNRLAANEDGFSSIDLPTGDGEWNIHAGLSISQSLHPLPAYVNLSGGYNKRTSFEGQNFKDQWTVNTQLGYQFFDKVWLQVQLGVQQSIEKPEGLVSFVRGDGSAFTQYGLNLSYLLNDAWGLGLQYYNNADFIIERVNVYESATLGFSVFFQKDFSQKQ